MFGRIAKDPRFERLPCVHKGTYADDCLVDRVTQVNASALPCWTLYPDSVRGDTDGLASLMVLGVYILSFVCL